MNLRCEDTIKEKAKNSLRIRQGYLSFSKGTSLRIRETDGKRHEMTYKQKVNDRVVEIETKISQRDFNDLWSVAANKLDKIRYNVMTTIKSGTYCWEVDFFKDHHDHNYIAVAEHEMPEGQLEVSYIPKIIKRNLVFPVPRSDDRFASKRLANVKYAKDLYNSIKPKGKRKR